MYDLNDTIVAVSSSSSQQQVIIRISGLDAYKICSGIFRPDDEQGSLIKKQKILAGRIAVDDQLDIDVFLYLFPAPHSYTGDDVAEIHLYTNSAVTEALFQRIVAIGVRPAEPGEFTARAYLNGKMDLAQAEAVNEIIVSTNILQLDASEKLLAGGLSCKIKEIRTQMLDCLSLIESGLDFSGEDIEQITSETAVKKLHVLQNQLQNLLAGGIYYDSVMDMPSVGIAGAPNAGKSSLLNAILGTERSIVSPQRKTTRDVLTGQLKLKHCQVVMFDCAGLVLNPETIIDQLAQQAAIEALKNSTIVVFCVDISKQNWAEDSSILGLINPRILIPLATKCDLLSPEIFDVRLSEINRFFGMEFLAVSAKNGTGLNLLCKKNDEHLVSGQLCQTNGLAITSRHKRILNESLTSLDDAKDQIREGNDEIAAMLLRIAYKNICSIEQHLGQPVDEQLLDEIFSRFCIGK
jgi:tRNA modification GTPase